MEQLAFLDKWNKRDIELDGEKLPEIKDLKNYSNFNWVDTSLTLGREFKVIKDVAESLGFKFIGTTDSRNPIYSKEDKLYTFSYHPCPTISYAEIELEEIKK